MEHRTTGLTRFAGVVGDGMPTRNNEQHGKPTRLVASVAGPTEVMGGWAEGVVYWTIEIKRAIFTGSGIRRWGTEKANPREGGLS